MHIVLVIGLPASGKTAWAQKQLFALRDAGLETRMVDNPYEIQEVDEALSWVGVRGSAPRVLFVVDPHLCDPATLALAQEMLRDKAPGATQHIVCFENDAAQCKRNLRLQRLGEPDPAVLAAIEQLSLRYRPTGKKLPVNRPAPSVAPVRHMLHREAEPTA